MTSAKWRPFCLGLNVLTSIMGWDKEQPVPWSVDSNFEGSQVVWADDQIYQLQLTITRPSFYSHIWKKF